ncbi:hypothetical protein IFM89_007541 [Coptis chinensis]|uniref:Uncharacterized protein n=1 Tax=Coptis chinensis TaxID=261450 RepID=A0A835LUP1_9MAGN|nr:hypothetical protein IFM89_007541 [Coptis chinensis]
MIHQLNRSDLYPGTLPEDLCNFQHCDWDHLRYFQTPLAISIPLFTKHVNISTMLSNGSPSWVECSCCLFLCAPERYMPLVLPGVVGMGFVMLTRMTRGILARKNCIPVPSTRRSLNPLTFKLSRAPSLKRMYSRGSEP